MRKNLEGLRAQLCETWGRSPSPMGVAYPRPGPEVGAGGLPSHSKRRAGGCPDVGAGSVGWCICNRTAPCRSSLLYRARSPGAALTIIDSARPLVPAAPAVPAQEAATFSAMRVRIHVGAIFRLSALAREGRSPLGAVCLWAGPEARVLDRRWD